MNFLSMRSATPEGTRELSAELAGGRAAFRLGSIALPRRDPERSTCRPAGRPAG